MNKYKASFIEETYKDITMYYRNALNNRNYEHWDYIVLTASNRKQKEIYEKEIEYRVKTNFIDKKIKFLVIEDLDGKRIGSGGATLNVYIELYKILKEKIFNKKILILHSGGDSKRIPQYSACGKLFSPIQRELFTGKSSTLFDEIMITFSSIPSRMSNGSVILSGDTLLLFNPLQVDLFHLPCAGISIKEDVSTGKNHGVFLTNTEGMLKEFLHKETIEILKNKKAVNDQNKVDIDTGAIYFSNEVIKSLLSLIIEDKNINKIKYHKYLSEELRLNLYGDFLYPFSSDAQLEEYLKLPTEGNGTNLVECRTAIWNCLNQYRMKIIKTSPSVFIHYGTTHELLSHVNEELKNYKNLGWKRNTFSNIENTNINFSINSSLIEDDALIGNNSYIEHSIIGKNVKVGSNVIISNTNLTNIQIPNNICLSTYKLNNKKYVTRIYDINDNAKDTIDKTISFLGKNLNDFITENNLLDLLWKTKEEKNLWNAKLYKMCDCEALSIKSALDLYDLFQKDNSKDIKTYFNSERISLQESFNNCDNDYYIKNEEKIEIKIRSQKYINMLKNNMNIIQTLNILKYSSNINEQIKDLEENVNNVPQNIKLRIYLAISYLKNSDIKYEDKAYNEIRKGLLEFKQDKKRNIKETKEKVEVELPIRINFAGGWSDTPPYCIEMGGSVLNGSFTLNNDKPVKVTVKKIKEKVIVLKSIDLGFEKKYTNINELKNCSNTNDIFSLLKASMLTAGIIQENDKSINEVIQRIGSGFEFVTNVHDIPKGSGLGTSSILAAACLKALYKFINVDINLKEIGYEVLYQEQLMGTGGGWQDQIGGLFPGIKLIDTEIGYNQTFEINKIKLTSKMNEFFNNRLVLIYSGQRRLAKNILRNIMNKYIINNETIIQIINSKKENAKNMYKAILNSDIEKFNKSLNEDWQLTKQLDEGCSNTCIEQILSTVEDLIDARMICGAGGGGFLQVILKEKVKISDLENRINDVFEQAGVKVYKIDVSEDE